MRSSVLLACYVALIQSLLGEHRRPRHCQPYSGGGVAIIDESKEPTMHFKCQTASFRSSLMKSLTAEMAAGPATTGILDAASKSIVIGRCSWQHHTSSPSPPAPGCEILLPSLMLLFRFEEARY